MEAGLLMEFTPKQILPLLTICSHLFDVYASRAVLKSSQCISASVVLHRFLRKFHIRAEKLSTIHVGLTFLKRTPSNPAIASTDVPRIIQRTHNGAVLLLKKCGTYDPFSLYVRGQFRRSGMDRCRGSRIISPTKACDFSYDSVYDSL